MNASSYDIVVMQFLYGSSTSNMNSSYTLVHCPAKGQPVVDLSKEFGISGNSYKLNINGSTVQFTFTYQLNIALYRAWGIRLG